MHFAVPTSVAEVGGIVEVEIPGSGSIFQVRVPPGMHLGSRLQISVPAPAASARTQEPRGTGEGSPGGVPSQSRQAIRALGDDLGAGACCSCSSSSDKKSTKSGGEGLSVEQQFIMASVVAGAVGLVVGVTVLTTALDLQEYLNLVIGASLLVLLLVLEAFLETGCTPLRYRPALLAFSIMLSHLVLVLLFLSVSAGTRSRLAVGWVWGAIAGGLAIAHSRQILSHMHRGSRSGGGGGGGGGSGNNDNNDGSDDNNNNNNNSNNRNSVDAGAWFLSRLMAQSLPFLGVWIFALMDYDPSDGEVFRQEASRHLVCVLCCLGTLVPTFEGSAPIFGGVVGGGGWLKRSLKNLGSGSRGPSGGGGGGDDDDDDDVGDVDADDDEAAALDEEEEAADVREVRKAEAHQGVWVLLVGATFCALLGPSGGLYALRFATPAAAAAAASCFFPLAALRSGLEAKKHAALRRRGHPLLPAGTGVALLALVVLAVGVAACAAAEGSVRDSAFGEDWHGAVFPFFALLVGTVAHYTLDTSDDIHTARVVVAITMAVSAFWTGSRVTSIATVPVAVLVFGSLQVPWWRSIQKEEGGKDGEDEEEEEEEEEEVGSRGGEDDGEGAAGGGGGGQITMPAGAVAAVAASDNKESGGGGEDEGGELPWYHRSIKPAYFLVGLGLCAASFVATDWMSYRSPLVRPPIWLRALRSVVLLYVPTSGTALANLKRARDRAKSTDAAACCKLVHRTPPTLVWCGDT